MTATAAATEPWRPRDPVWLLSAYLVLLLVLPASLVLGSLGAEGTPAAVVSVAAAGWWLLARASGGLGLAIGPQPVRTAILVHGWVMGLGYAVAMARPLSAAESSGANRGLVWLVAVSGITLLAADGIADRARLDALLRRVVLGVTGVAGVGIVQFFTDFDPTRFLVLPGLEANRELNQILGRGDFNRPAATATHPIEFGVVVAMVLPLAITFALHRRPGTSAVRAWAPVAVLGLALPLSVSRSAVLGVVLAGGIVAAGWSWRRRWQALGLAACAAVALQMAVPGLLGTLRGLFTNAEQDPSVLARVERFDRVEALVAQAPWLGHGFGTHNLEDFFLLDNQLFLTLIEGGVVGLAAVAALFVVGLGTARAARRAVADEPGRDLGLALLAALAVPASTLATFDLLKFRMVTGLTFLVLGCIGALWRLAPPKSRTVPAPTWEQAARRGRVLIVVQNLPVPMDRRVWMECRSLIAAGFGVSVICPMAPGDPAYQVLDGVHLHKYRPAPATKGAASFAYEFVYAWLQTARLALRVRRREGFDVLQACNPPDTYFALAALLKPFGIRFVFDQHDLCPEVYASRFAKPSRVLVRVLRLLERATYRTADHVITTNDSFRGVALKRGGRSPLDVTVVRSGPRATVMRAQAPEPALRGGRRHLCCYLGIMGPQDGVDYALRAAAVLVRERGRRDCSFAFLGFGDSLDELRELSSSLGLDDFVTFTGRADDRMIARYLSTADIGLSPDPKNAMNDLCTMNKTLEYMAFGLPVVAFDLRETRVSAGGAALYAQPNEVEAYADAIELLLDDPERRAGMGRAGRARIEDGLSWEHQSRRYVDVYRRVLAS